ncbi:MAG: [FeFe] hydrogenase, group A [Candidatus Accumulibacter sp.]|jgi:ferredoxin hydrogenase gamma subunit|nr:[FeFe] hydrogenase, group A [Accumulibacter sp.]
MKARINDKEVHFEPNQTILEAARANGIFIPTLCEYHDLDHTPGTCRVCLVEVRQPGSDEAQYLTSCNTPMTENSAVRTMTPKVQEMRRFQMEMAMSDHNEDCATCTRQGDCELIDAANSTGLKKIRFHYTKAWMPPEAGTKPVVYDKSRCIRCYRCIAVCRKVQDIDALEADGWGPTAGVRLKAGTYDASPCVSCGQCVMVCPTGAMSERDQVQEVVDYIADPDIVTVFQTAPAIRVDLGDEFGLPPGSNVEGQIIAALRRIGVDVILDTNFGADLVIMEEGTEVLGRLKAKAGPTFTSCCPAWINYAEKHYPEILPMISSTRSPQAVMGKMIKTYLAEKRAIDPAKIRVVSIMPCTAKKEEAARKALSENGVPDVDIVLTVREFARLIRRYGLDVGRLEPSTYDDLLMSEYSGAGAIFATTGGVMEAAVRTLYYVVNGKELEGIEVTGLRGFENVRSATVEVGGELGSIRLAICHGLRGTRKLVEAVLSGEEKFDFIEVMSCPGGCVDGGGTPRQKKSYIPFAKKRQEALFTLDRQKKPRQSHNNTQIQKLYADFLETPNSEKAHHLLHTHYTARGCGANADIPAAWAELKDQRTEERRQRTEDRRQNPA